MMHHDKKICLALGILLVGIVAALFFRNESGAGQQVPQLADPKALDARIADKPVRPYDAREADQPPQRATVVSNDGNLQPQFTYDGFDSRRSKRAESKRPVEFTQLGPPEPIKPKTGGPGSARPVSRTIAAGMRTYRVKKGDTLSGIALKFLGSSRRYNEIYKANRDVLRTPNSLREGMLLRIPERKEPQPALDEPIAKTSQKRNAAAASRPRTASAPGTPVIAERRFVPVRRSPFLLGRRNGFVSKHGNGQFSQMPPEKDSQATSADVGKGKPVTILPPPAGKPAAAPQGQAQRVYVVRKGDSLERIARKVYGTPRATGRILDANKDRLKSANQLRAGMKIVLP